MATMLLCFLLLNAAVGMRDTPAFPESDYWTSELGSDSGSEVDQRPHGKRSSQNLKKHDGPRRTGKRKDSVDNRPSLTTLSADVVEQVHEEKRESKSKCWKTFVTWKNWFLFNIMCYGWYFAALDGRAWFPFDVRYWTFWEVNDPGHCTDPLHKEWEFRHECELKDQNGAMVKAKCQKIQKGLDTKFNARVDMPGLGVGKYYVEPDKITPVPDRCKYHYKDEILVGNGHIGHDNKADMKVAGDFCFKIPEGIENKTLPLLPEHEHLDTPEQCEWHRDIPHFAKFLHPFSLGLLGSIVFSGCKWYINRKYNRKDDLGYYLSCMWDYLFCGPVVRWCCPSTNCCYHTSRRREKTEHDAASSSDDNVRSPESHISEHLIQIGAAAI